MKIHFIAIGGSVMHSLAIALSLKGYQITGSDDKIADPALTNLKNQGIMPDRIGFYPERIHAGLDAVILGMHARADNPELLRAQEMHLPIYSFPEYLYEFAKDKKRIVIGGSHGKTTITSMVMHVLRGAGIDIDYMVGARVKGFDGSVRLTEAAPVIVLEGDEYLASPIDRESKFLFYKPHIGLITGVAWDHINVFPDYSVYVNQFRRFAESVVDGGSIIYYYGDKELQHIFSTYKGPGRAMAYADPDYEVRAHTSYIKASGMEYQMSVFGPHNMQNIEGARMVCSEMGIRDAQFYDLIGSFEGAANRLQKLGENKDTVIYKDFAHSPSKLRATVTAMQAQYPERPLVAVMELHTFSSLNKDFLDEYAHSMDAAHTAVVFIDEEALLLKQMPPLDPSWIKKSFSRDDLNIFTSASDLEDFLLAQSWAGSNLLMMTSGHFGGMDVAALVRQITA